jgi:hypothetical protein
MTSEQEMLWTFVGTVVNAVFTIAFIGGSIYLLVRFLHWCWVQ